MARASCCLFLLAAILPHTLAKAPVLRVSESYVGRVSEKGGRVEMEPPIRADNGPICGYRLTATTNPNIPFEIFTLDQTEGTAELRARRPLDCEERRSYDLEVAAVACTGEISHSVPVVVRVEDVNEYLPIWDEEEYSAEVGEGEMKEPILTITAKDRDCSPTFGSICGYTITSPEQPFAIDDHGSIRNVRPLSAAESRSHVLSVVARDCGGRESSPVLVTINVLPKCLTSWTDLSTSMTYIPGTGPQPVFPAARLQICPATCPVERIETMLTLHTDHVGVGCDRDTYSLASQRKMCGASSHAVDLLPAESEAVWLKDLKSDRGREASPVYHFDGVAAGALIPEAVLGHDLGSEFTIATWLRHAAGDKEDKHSKEHILCLADDHRKNRHHLSLFLRNCKLVLLVRREYREEERNVFKPAEWRWSLPQVCDDSWHHYAVSMSPAGGVELTLDGELWSPEPNNPEVIDDWPLHPAADLHTALTVGACWHGAEGAMRHRLRGYLAGLAVLAGRREHAEVLKCLVQCSESLQLPATSLLDPGMEMVTNTQGSQVTIDGEDAGNMEELVRQVAYLNTREFPAPGRRRLELATTITCKDGTRVEVPEAVSRVLVLPVPRPSITLAGSSNLSRGYEDFKRGVRIFSDLRLSVSRAEAEGEPSLFSTSSETKVDKCSISIFPPLNPDHEAMELPEPLLTTLAIAATRTDSGAEMRGADRLYNYEQVLRQVTYTNQKPAYYLNRQFKLVCSELNERFVSNEYVQTLTVIHPPLPSEGLVAARPAHHQVSYHGAELPAPHFLTLPQDVTGSLQGHTVVVVVAVCVLLLLTVLLVGVLRLRTAHKRAAEEEVEMAWDDTALNITVNPLEEAECRAMGGARPIESEVEESDEDDMYVDESSEDEDDEDEDDEGHEGGGGPSSRHRLEWDNAI